MTESTLVPLVGASSVVIALAVLGFGVYSRNRPSLIEGPWLVTVAFLGMLAGLAVLLVGEAAHGAGILVYVGGAVCLVGVFVLTGVIAAVPHPEGEEEGHGH